MNCSKGYTIWTSNDEPFEILLGDSNKCEFSFAWKEYYGFFPTIFIAEDEIMRLPGQLGAKIPAYMIIVEHMQGPSEMVVKDVFMYDEKIYHYRRMTIDDLKALDIFTELEISENGESNFKFIW